MKKYTTNIGKLYENVGFEKIESGKTYTTQKGGKVTIMKMISVKMTS